MSDDGKLFGVSEALRVVGCGVVDMIAACNPSRVGVFPEGFDELTQPWKINVIRWRLRVEVLEDCPVSREDTTEKGGGTESLLLMKDGTENTTLFTI